MEYILGINNAYVLCSITLFKFQSNNTLLRRTQKSVLGWLGYNLPARNIQAENLYPIHGLSHSVYKNIKKLRYPDVYGLH